MAIIERASAAFTCATFSAAGRPSRRQQTSLAAA
jgi:hypothetical protein